MNEFARNPRPELARAAFFILGREELAVSLVGVHQAIFGALFIAVVLILPGGLVEAGSRLRRQLPPARRDRPD